MNYLFLLGRVLFGGFFVMSSLGHFMKTNDMAGYAASKKIPMPKFSVLASGLLLFLGGLWIVLGTLIFVGAVELLLFLVPAAFLMHDFWNVTDPQMKMTQQLMFMRNIALIGAVLMMLAIPSPWPFAAF
jgi:uncharacterized membrane protein YphA (DoxX/SURF4 family)